MDQPMDLVIVAADGSIEAAMRGVLSRHEALGIRPVTYDVFTHVHRDPGCLLEADDLLRPLACRYRYALVAFDRLGSGRHDLGRQALQQLVVTRVSQAAWRGRVRVLVLDPELEAWVWSDSPQVDRCLGWSGRIPALRQWLAAEGLWPPERPKPPDPKVAFRAALREAGRPVSSAIFADLARSVSLHRCTDPAFAELRGILQGWFGTP
jgi:hypothetical protein